MSFSTSFCDTPGKIQRQMPNASKQRAQRGVDSEQCKTHPEWSHSATPTWRILYRIRTCSSHLRVDAHFQQLMPCKGAPDLIKNHCLFRGALTHIGSWRGAKRHEGSCSGCCCPSRVETQKNTRTGVVSRRRVTFWPAGAAASCRLAIRSVWRCSAAVPGTTQAAVWPISSQMNTSVQPIDPPLQIETFPAPWRKVVASWCGRVPTPGRASGGPHAVPANWEINPDAHYTLFAPASIGDDKKKTRCTQLKRFECLDLRLLKP